MQIIASLVPTSLAFVLFSDIPKFSFESLSLLAHYTSRHIILFHLLEHRLGLFGLVFFLLNLSGGVWPLFPLHAFGWDSFYPFLCIKFSPFDSLKFLLKIIGTYTVCYC